MKTTIELTLTVSDAWVHVEALEERGHELAEWAQTYPWRAPESVRMLRLAQNIRDTLAAWGERE